MQLPQAARKAGIVEKLNFSAELLSELHGLIAEAYKNDDRPKFVAQRAETILSSSRECFDHLALDIVEGHLLPCASPRFKQRYFAADERKRPKCYFPFYAPMFQTAEWLVELKAASRPLFDELAAFVAAMDSDSLLLPAGIRVRTIREVARMVNEKKHDKVTEILNDQIDKVFVASGESSFIFDKGFRNDHPEIRIVIPSGGRIERKVASFRFSSNGIDVGNLCGQAIAGTRTAMDFFYRYFQGSDMKVMPPPLPLPTITTRRAPPGWTMDESVLRLPPDVG